MPARDPRDVFSLRETMRTLRPPQKPRARATGVSLLTLFLAPPLSLFSLTSALPTEMPLAIIRENLTAAAASSPSLMDSAVSSIYRTLCPIFTDCEVAQAASAAVATAAVRTSRPVRRVLGAASSTASMPQGATAGPAQSATPEPAAPPHTTVIERIVERVLPAYSLASAEGITEDVLNARLAALDSSLRQIIFQNVSYPNSLPATGGVTNNIALSQRIDNLIGTTITNPTITGGSISASSIVGTISSAVSSAFATIDDLTSTYYQAHWRPLANR
jgi:hypothetical protein